MPQADSTSAEDMVERVALAIEATMWASHELPLSDDLHRKYRHTAAAAIEAMREPTRPMWANAANAFLKANRHYLHHDRVSEIVWTAMMQAALNPGVA